METLMPLVQVKSKSQITLPQKVRMFLGIQEGDYLEIAIEKTHLILKPKAIIDKFPEIELSARGQKMLQESLDEVAKGKVKAFDTIEDLIGHLHHISGQKAGA